MDMAEYYVAKQNIIVQNVKRICVLYLVFRSIMNVLTMRHQQQVHQMRRLVIAVVRVALVVVAVATETFQVQLAAVVALAAGPALVEA